MESATERAVLSEIKQGATFIDLVDRTSLSADELFGAIESLERRDWITSSLLLTDKGQHAASAIEIEDEEISADAWVGAYRNLQ